MEDLDNLIEEIEVLSNEITKINFDIEGIREENERLQEKQPYMVRHIQKNEKTLFKMATELTKKMETKHMLDAKLQVEQIALQDQKKEEKVDKNDKA